jgi:superfamily I DNA/RNA helicase
MKTPLSDSQAAVLGGAVQLVEACPGAGKTRAIVARFNQLATSTQRAVALVSFTNAAVDEAIKRCAATPRAIQAPNFIGTFDRFIRRFVVTPVVQREAGRSPRYLDSWADLPDSFDTSIRHSEVAGKGLSLRNFHVGVDGTVSYPSETPQEDKAYAAQLAKAGYSSAALLDYAGQRIKQLTSSGFYDCEQSRLKALDILSNPVMVWLHKRLAQRFDELIVDEFQDCSSIEHEILGRLESFGTRVVVVGDPDQAIYEFRQAAPSSYTAYRDRIPSDRIVYLDENWRSSPAICHLTSSLRSISQRPIVSRRDPTQLPHADVVYVVVGTAKHARDEFDRIATTLDIPAGERLVLASTRKAVIELAGQPPGAGVGKTQTSKIIRSVATLRFSRIANDRKDAITVVEAVLLGTIKFAPELQRASRQEQLDAAGLEQAELRMMVARLVEVSSSWSDANSATSSIRMAVAALLANVNLGFTPTGQRFRKADSADWKAFVKVEKAVDDSLELTGTHIHSFKGAECDAVLLDIEDEAKGTRPHVIDLWASDTTHEARRVLYVGASRARRLLMLAVAPSNVDALRAVLSASGVQVQYLEQGPSAV